jgi:hypothetical protein
VVSRVLISRGWFFVSRGVRVHLGFSLGIGGFCTHNLGYQLFMRDWAGDLDRVGWHDYIVRSGWPEMTIWDCLLHET